MRTVLLSIGMEPLGIVNWGKAFSLVYEGKAELLWSYPDKKIRSAFAEWEWPSIVSLKYDIQKRPFRNINPSTRAILIRDLYTCQYCGKHLTNATGTKDHVIPDSKGGRSSWDNLVAACKDCQGKKADFLPEECRMFPKKHPKAPSLVERFQANLKVAPAYERKNWKIGMRKLGLEYLIDNSDE